MHYYRIGLRTGVKTKRAASAPFSFILCGMIAQVIDFFRELDNIFWANIDT